MADYWVTFRIASDQTYQDRYNALLDAMIKLRGQNASWGEPTSYWAFRSENGNLESVARTLTAGLKATKDILVVGILDSAITVYFGAIEHPQAFTEMFPLSKKLA